MDTGAALVVEAAEAFLSVVSSFDLTTEAVADCVRVAEVAARVEKAAGTVRLVAAARAVDAGAHKEAGVADPVSWLARQGGTTGAEARGALELARSLEDHPATKEALLEGAISVAQAKEIAKAEAESPGQEKELLDLARDTDLTGLRDETRERKLARTPPEELHEAQVAARRFRHWRDGLGMVCFEGALPPETGVPFVNRIQRRAAELRRGAKRDGSAERFCAYAADALVELVGEGAGADRRPVTELVIVCDLYAWRRGHTHPGEPCHLIGGGPIPVDLAKELARDTFVKIVLHDGVDIQRVHHAGRKCTAELRTALDLGPVPAFSGRECTDCGRRWGLEYDHDDPVAHTGRTSIANVKARCWPCHQDKTERDRVTGLLGKKAKARGPGPPAQKMPAARRAPARRAPTAPDPP